MPVRGDTNAPMPPSRHPPLGADWAVGSLLTAVAALILIPAASIITLVFSLAAWLGAARNPNRYGHPRIAIAATLVALVGLALWIGGYQGVLLNALRPSPSRAQHLACASNLRGIMQALIAYEQATGQFPGPDDDWVACLTGSGLLPPQIFRCWHRQGANTVAYVYVPMHVEELAVNTIDSRRVVAFERPDANTHLVAVGFGDNHVELVPLAEFERMLSELRNADGTPWRVPEPRPLP